MHASTNRGILIRPYENRMLSEAGQFYDAKGFALCLACHMETPFMNRLRPAAAEGTNFVFHGLHTSGITTKGSGGLDIDMPGAGQGNARCAECHFSNHGTTQPAERPEGVRRPARHLRAERPAEQAVGGLPKFTKTATGGTLHRDLPRQGPPGRARTATDQSGDGEGSLPRRERPFADPHGPPRASASEPSGIRHGLFGDRRHTRL